MYVRDVTKSAMLVQDRIMTVTSRCKVTPSIDVKHNRASMASMNVLAQTHSLPKWKTDHPYDGL